MGRVDLQHGAATDVGRVRQANEDSLLVAPPVFAVADGMGGHDGGDVASRIVVEELAHLAGTDHDVRRGAEAVSGSLARAQARLREYAEGQRVEHPLWHAGTTAVVALLVDSDDGPQWLLANLGDSRIYCLAGGGLQQVSVDHSVVQELVDAGEITPGEALTHPERHVITRALGGSGSVEPDYFLLPLAAVERLLLCSDGINGMIDDADIEHVLATVPDPTDAAEALVQAALEAGGRDNATAVVVDAVVAGADAGAADEG
jgi:serine/threonine protein phosphatase PrpC